jgi:hypothetical protein
MAQNRFVGPLNQPGNRLLGVRLGVPINFRGVKKQQERSDETKRDKKFHHHPRRRQPTELADRGDLVGRERKKTDGRVHAR